MKDSLYTLLYTAILGTVCAVLLTGAAQYTKPYREANAKAERMQNILHVLGVPFEADANSQALVRVFEKEVRQKEVKDPAGRLEPLTVFEYIPSGGDGALAAMAVQFEGQGLWAPIKGFLSLEPDRRTIRGVTFYEQEETPGLGGEIGAEWFRKQFVGKKIQGLTGEPGIRIRTGATAINEVDAITGATMTCDKVQDMLNAVIRRIVAKGGPDG